MPKGILLLPIPRVVRTTLFEPQLCQSTHHGGRLSFGYASVSGAGAIQDLKQNNFLAKIDRDLKPEPGLDYAQAKLEPFWTIRHHADLLPT